MADEGIEKLIRPELAKFGGYAASKSPDILKDKFDMPAESIIKLDANENPYGCSPQVNKALAGYTDINVYCQCWQRPAYRPDYASLYLTRRRSDKLHAHLCYVCFLYRAKQGQGEDGAEG